MKAISPKTPSALINRGLGLLGALVAAGAILIGSPDAKAASANWLGSGTSTSWSDTTAWSTSPVPGTGDTATFNAAATSGTNIDLGGGVTIGSVVFSGATAGAYNIGTSSSQNLTLDNGGTITVQSTVASNETFKAKIILSGSATITKSNTSKILTLGTIVGGSSANTLTLSTVDTATNGADYLVSAINDGTAALALSKAGSGSMAITGSSSYSGGTTINAGSIYAKASNALGSGDVVVKSGATLFGFASTVNLPNNVQLNGGSAITITGATDMAISGDLTVASASTVTVPNTANDSFTASGNLILSSTLTIGAGISDKTIDATLGGSTKAISGGGGILLDASGAMTTGTVTLKISGSNTYTGDTKISTKSGATGLALLQVNNPYALQNSTLDMSTSASVKQVSFTAGVGTYYLGGLKGASSIGIGANTLNIGGNNQSTSFTGSITDSGSNGSIVKVGSGGLTLGGAASSFSSLVVTSGSVIVTNAGALGNANSVSTGAQLVLSGGITVNSAPVALANGSVLSGAGNALTNSLGGNIALSTGTAQISVDPGSSLVISGAILDSGSNGSVSKVGTGNLTLGGSNSSFASFAVTTGTVIVTNGGALGAANSVSSGAQLALSGGITVSGDSLTIAGSGGGNLYGALMSTSGTNTWAGNITLGANNTRLGADSNSTLIVSGVIDGPSNFGVIIQRATTGVTVLSGSNTYLGSTNILNGLVKLSGGDNRLPIATMLSFGGTNVSGTLDLNGVNQEVAGLSVVSGANSNGTVLNSSATLSTIAVNTATASTFAGQIKSNVSLAKNGSDTLTLTGTSTYTGATKVLAGKLVVSGALSASSAVTIGDTVNLSTLAVLGGAGSVGDVTVGAAAGNSGATLRPHEGNSSTSAGNSLSVGALTFADSSAHLDLKLGRTSAGTGLTGEVSDKVVASGAISLNNADLDVSLLSSTGYTPVSGDVLYLVINNSGNAVSGFFGSLNGVSTNLTEGAQLSFSGQNYLITYQADSATGSLSGGDDIALVAVPEPGTWAMLLGGLGMLVFGQRLRSRSC